LNFKRAYFQHRTSIVHQLSS